MSKISVNLASIESRKDILPQVIESLLNQTVKPDIIRVYCNDYTPDLEYEGVIFKTDGQDLTDNGKFYWADKDKDTFYFSADDDIYYADNYIENTLHYLKKYNSHWITYHGRKLNGKGLNYYHGHDVYQCLRTVDGNWEIDVCGTGVSAFHTSLLDVDISAWEHQRMSDLMMSRELAKKGIPILCVQHKIWWLKSLLKRTHSSIYREEEKDCSIQNQIADEIWERKYT